MIRYAPIVSMEGITAEEPLKIFKEKGPNDLYHYLKKWDNGKYHDIQDEKRMASRDINWEISDYIITVNVYYRYVRLTKIITQQEYETFK